jgi:hypothetical protein
MDPFPVNMAVVPQQEYRIMHPCKRFTLAVLWGLLGIVLITFVVIENVGKIMQIRYLNATVPNVSLTPAVNLSVYHIVTNESGLF